MLSTDILVCTLLCRKVRYGQGTIKPRATEEVKVCSVQWCHIVPHRKFDMIGGISYATFPNFNMLSLERTVLKEIVLITLFQNKSWNKYRMLSVAGQYPNYGRRYFLPLDGAAYPN